MDKLNKKENKLLQQIADHLILNASTSSNIGLYHGKIGAVLFFAHYARYTENKLYDDFSGVLLDDVYKEIHLGLPIDFENGLCGIGWAIEYLLQKGFMKGDSDEALRDIDKKIMEYNLKRIENLDVCTGLTGISYYIHTRLHSPCRKSKNPPFDTTYLTDWNSVKDNIIIPDNDQILQDILPKKLRGTDFLSWELGLNTGCIGKGLKILL